MSKAFKSTQIENTQTGVSLFCWQLAGMNMSNSCDTFLRKHTALATTNLPLRHHAKRLLSPLVPPGPPSRGNRLLLGPADRRRLRGSAGGGLPLGHPAAGPRAGRLLPPSSTPPAGPVLHPVQPGRVQEPACHPAPRPGHQLLRRPRRWRKGKGLGVR